MSPTSFCVKFIFIIVYINESLAYTFNGAHKKFPLLIVHGDSNGKF